MDIIYHKYKLGDIYASKYNHIQYTTLGVELKYDKKSNRPYAEIKECTSWSNNSIFGTRTIIDTIYGNA